MLSLSLNTDVIVALTAWAVAGFIGACLCWAAIVIHDIRVGCKRFSDFWPPRRNDYLMIAFFSLFGYVALLIGAGWMLLALSVRRYKTYRCGLTYFR